MAVPLLQVDAFTDRPFAGNPAAVCFLDRPRPDEWMQLVAAGMNLSETAFVERLADGYRLRWFTPATEVDLCGHATLASAHALWETGRLSAEEPARFHTLSGLLTCRRRADWIEMDFPSEPLAPADPPATLVEAIGCTPRWVGRNRMDYLVELDDETAVCGLAPAMDRLRTVETRGVIVTARSSEPDVDFVSRFFGPRVGVDEDPVTGSSHCCLGPFWGERIGKADLVGRQVSRRGGVVRVSLADDRVRLGGQAVTVLRGELLG
jgi:predicted PhzF superfamily epimerase YddE/YHI9